MKTGGFSILRPGAFRLFLATTVLVSHSCRFDPGDWAVYSFFILSGFWISRMWKDKYSRTDAPGRVFIASRLLHLLPVFLLANLITALVAVHTDPVFLNPSAEKWGVLPAIASNLLILGYSSLPHSQGALHVAWSLDVELQFYAVLPLASLLLASDRMRIFWTVFLGAVCCIGLSIFIMDAAPGPRNLGCCGIYFLAGVLAERRRWRPSRATVSFVGATAIAFVAVCWLVPGWEYLFENLKHGSTAVDFHHRQIAQALLALYTAPVAIESVHRASDTRDRALGEFTYVMYLMHWPVILVHSYYFALRPPLSRLPSLAGAWLVIAALSWAVYQFYDQPIERARKRWVASRMATQPLPVPAGG